MDWVSFLLLRVCPTAGCVLAALMFCAPLRDLNDCLQRGSLGTMNPIPWAVAVGNTFGWLFYGLITKDVFVLAANLPGLFINIWLCYGAVKLQYYRRQKSTIVFDTSQIRQGDDNSTFSTNTKDFDLLLSFTPLEQVFFGITASWAILGAYTGWFTTTEHAASIIGVTVNCNLVFFYAAPLNTIWSVIKTRNSSWIHKPTMVMNTVNATFWVLYGCARHDRIILFPNAIGSLLGLIQIFVCVLYPHMPIEVDDDDDYERNSTVNYNLMDENSRSS